MRRRAVLLLMVMAATLVAAGGLVWAASGDSVADRVLGQGNFTNNQCNKGQAQASPGKLCKPHGVAVAPSGRLYVADTDNSRVLSWPSAATFTNGQDADLVIGQANFLSNTCNNGGVSAGSLCHPLGVAVDGVGNLYVGDKNNHRVLEYDDPAANDGIADRVFGQQDFAGNLCNRGGEGARPISLCSPRGFAAKGANLYVADYNNNRVLEYDTPLTSDAEADLVFGQNDFNSGQCNKGLLQAGPASHSRLCFPWGVAVGGGNLYVADTENNRVLRYDSPLTTDAAADLVIGQANFMSNQCNKGGAGPNTSRLCFPIAVAVGGGNLYVADAGNSRVLEYDTPLVTNAQANLVFGQANFTSKGCTGGASGLCNARGVAADAADNLYISDTTDNRALGYDKPIP